jgi:hypothetical protein
MQNNCKEYVQILSIMHMLYVIQLHNTNQNVSSYLPYSAQNKKSLPFTLRFLSYTVDQTSVHVEGLASFSEHSIAGKTGSWLVV